MLTAVGACARAASGGNKRKKKKKKPSQTKYIDGKSPDCLIPQM